MTVAYIDPVSGASGDMLLGALVDAGLELEAMRDALAGLRLPGWSLRMERVTRGGFPATRVHVDVAEDAPPRTLGAIEVLLGEAALDPVDRENALWVFRLLGEAEAEAHGAADVQSSHLHEVGAVDALVDVVGTVAGLRLLGVQRLHRGSVPAGGGTVRAAHGRLPVPAPAVLAIARRTGLELASPRRGEPEMELLTPTGAALLGALATPGRPAMRLRAVGVGAGGRDPEGWPNVLRLWLGDAAEAASDALSLRPLVLLETNVDDMPAEHVPYVEERAREAGALDVWWAAEGMKKGRPGLRLSAIARPEDEAAVARALVRHTSTLGVRVTDLRRYEAEREVLRFDSSLGAAAVKVRRLPGEPPDAAPEYEDARLLAERHGLPLAEVYRMLTTEALAHLRGEQR